MESTNDYRYDLSLSFFSSSLADGAVFSPLSPFHNYVSCHIMHSQSTLSPPPATLTFPHCASKKSIIKNLWEVSRGERPLSGRLGVLNPATLCLILLPDATLPLVHYKRERGSADTTGFFLSVPVESFTLSGSSQPTDHRVHQCLCKVMKRQDRLNHQAFDCRPALRS